MPYNDCKENEDKVSTLISLPIDTKFEYQDIIDPDELSKIEQQVQGRKSEFETNIERIEKYSDTVKPTFDKIAQVKSTSDDRLANMVENKNSKLGKLFIDIPFILGTLDEFEQDEHLKKHKKWLKETTREIDKTLGIELSTFIEKVINTNMLIKSTEELLEADEGLNFLLYRDKLEEKKQQLVKAIHELDGHLEGINRLPHEKSEEFKKKMSTWLNISILPLGNLGVLFSIISLIKKFLPALSSSNSSYVSLRETLVKKFQVYMLVHIFLIIGSAVGSLFIELQLKPIFYALASIYAISGFVIFLKRIQLKKCWKEQF